MDEKIIWTMGQQDAMVAIKIFEYPKSIMASAKAEQITCQQVETAMAAEYPGLTFYAYQNGGPHGWIVTQCERIDDEHSSRYDRCPYCGARDGQCSH